MQTSVPSFAGQGWERPPGSRNGVTFHWDPACASTWQRLQTPVWFFLMCASGTVVEKLHKRPPVGGIYVRARRNLLKSFWLASCFCLLCRVIWSIMTEGGFCANLWSLNIRRVSPLHYIHRCFSPFFFFISICLFHGSWRWCCLAVKALGNRDLDSIVK